MIRESSINPSTLDELRELAGEDSGFVAKLLTLFVGAVAKESAALEESLGRKDFADIRAHAHALKSSALNIGARRLGSLCQALEAAASAGSLEELGRLLPEFREEARAAVSEVKSLPELAAPV